jgi:predicted phosphodiesterase
VKILAVSDEECAALWDHYVPGRLSEYDLIISCGDLKPEYLSFLVTMGRCPVLYVHGNHDTVYDENPPEGCDCIDDALVVYNGIRILGLGGCIRYHPGDYQYTEKQMARRIAKLHWKIRRLGGIDVVVTHAPPFGIGDDEDPAHKGFETFVELMDLYKPKYLIHGHVHLRYNPHTSEKPVREHQYEDTQIINVSERYTLEVPDVPFPEKDRGQIVWKTKHKD